MAKPRGQQRDKPFRDALRMEVARAGDDRPWLRRIASALLAKAESGDVRAIQEIGDRLDGKPAQAIVGDEDNPIEHIHRIERVIVNAKTRK